MTGYDQDYYLNGQKSGKSLYTDYRWMPDLTIPMCRAMTSHLQINHLQSVLDFGCARGYTVRALRETGYQAYGIDCSEWAITNCDGAIARFVKQAEMPTEPYDWIIAKDVLEHIESPKLDVTIARLLECARVGVFIVVPLSDESCKQYIVPEYEKDVTHVQRLSLMHWAAKLHALGDDFAIRCQYRVPGVKDNWAHYPCGNGFLTAYRMNHG